MEKEQAMREALFPELTPSEQKVQKEIAACLNTHEWDRKTGNGRSAAPRIIESSSAAPKSTAEAVVSGPAPRARASTATAPVTEEEEEEDEPQWVIERIDGALLTMEGRPRRQRRYFLVKWVGLGLEDNTWEPQSIKDKQLKSNERYDGVNARAESVKEFYRTYGWDAHKKRCI